MTRIPPDLPFNGMDARSRAEEVASVATAYGFASVTQLENDPATLDITTMHSLVTGLTDTLNRVAPDTLYVPWPGDAHSDHRVSFEAAVAAAKSFRSPSVRTILAYETLSETNFSINPTILPFRPHRYHDVSSTFAGKHAVLAIYQSELRSHPWPRSIDAIDAQGLLRGSECGAERAEAFVVVRDFQ
jgi:LmbE family N-acetylglucosaminyl deacetylase